MVCCREKVISHVGPAGVLAIPPEFSRGDVEAMIEEARGFAAEYSELSAYHRNALCGYCLQAPLKVYCFYKESCAGE